MLLSESPMTFTLLHVTAIFCICLHWQGFPYSSPNHLCSNLLRTQYLDSPLPLEARALVSSLFCFIFPSSNCWSTGAWIFASPSSFLWIHSMDPWSFSHLHVCSLSWDSSPKLWHHCWRCKVHKTPPFFLEDSPPTFHCDPVFDFFRSVAHWHFIGPHMSFDCPCKTSAQLLLLYFWHCLSCVPCKAVEVLTLNVCK